MVLSEFVKAVANIETSDKVKRYFLSMQFHKSYTMRIFLLIVLSILSIRSFSQNLPEYYLDKLYTGTLDEVLKEMTKDAGSKISFDPTLISKYHYASRFFHTKFEDAITNICDEYKLKYYVGEDNVIYLSSKKSSLSKSVVKMPAKHFVGQPVKTNYKITGRIVDAHSGESLPYVNVAVKNSTIGASSNVDGYFTLLDVPSDTCTLVTSYIGYKSEEIYLTPLLPTVGFEIQMTVASQDLEEVIVSAEKNELLRGSDKVGMYKLTPLKLSILPNLGEKDIFRSFQLLPGISAANENSSGLYVRGGTPDQSLVLFDGFTVYNVEHLFGFFSAFNSNAIKDVQLYKGGFGAKYGGRLSSVVDITGKEGNKKGFNMGLDLSLMSADFLAELPIGDKVTVLLGGRRSWQSPLYTKIFDKLTKKSSSSALATQPGRNNFGSESSTTSYFYDLNTKITYSPTKKDIFSFSFYNGADKLDNSIVPQMPSFMGGGGRFNFGTTDLTKWGNTGSSLKWSHTWSDKFYTNCLLSYSDYFSARDRSTDGSFIDSEGTEKSMKQGTIENNNINDLSVKSTFEYKITDWNNIEFGFEAKRNAVSYSYSQNDTSKYIDRHSNGSLYITYLQDKLIYLDERLVIEPGVRSTYYQPTKKVYLEPRLSATYQLNERFKLKMSAGKYNQFSNRVIREDILQGSRDFWVLADGKSLPVSYSKQYIAGFAWENRDWLLDVEGYYKNMTGLSEYSLRFMPKPGKLELEENYYTGTGRAIGIDMLLQKKIGKFTGWLGYTLGRTTHKFEVYGAKDFLASNDVTHEFKFVGMYKLGAWDFSASWIYASGRPYTAPEGGYQLTMLDGTTKDFINVSAKNGNRFPAYHRLDLSATFNFNLFDKFPSTLGVSLFNAYNRTNVWYRDYQIVEKQVVATDVNYLGITPNISFSIHLK